MVIKILELVKEYIPALSAFGVMIMFIFSVYKYQIDRKTELYWKEFRVFHNLIKELVEPTREDGIKYLDRQIAIVFELQNFKRYYPVILRILNNLRRSWDNPEYQTLIREIDLSIEYIETKI